MCENFLFTIYPFSVIGSFIAPTLFHDRVSGRLGPSDVDVMLGTMRKAQKENRHTPSHFQQSSRQSLLEVPPSSLVFQEKISRVKFINR